MLTRSETRNCVKCNNTSVKQIRLCQCHHVVCAGCLIQHLEFWIKNGKTRIKCASDDCAVRIHENDVRKVLDPENDELNALISRAERHYLLYKHDKDVIFYALGGDRFAKQCPLCRNIYAKMPGCNYVRCPNLRCNTWFCFHCALPAPTWQHFAQGQCKVGWDDVWKSTYALRFLLITNGFILFFLSPMIFFLFIFVLPLFVSFSFPVLTLRACRKKQKPSDDRQSGDVCCNILMFPLLFLVGLTLGVCSIFTGLYLYLLFIVIVLLKCIPGVGQVDLIINAAAKVAEMFGVTSWRQILRDALEAKDEKVVEVQQMELEQSERTAADETVTAATITAGTHTTTATGKAKGVPTMVNVLKGGTSAEKRNLFKAIATARSSEGVNITKSLESFEKAGKTTKK